MSSEIANLTIVIADSLTNDFLSPRPEFLQVRVNVGLSEIHRLLGKEEQFGSGPLPEFLRAAQRAEKAGRPVHLIFVRDLHELSDPHQLPEVLRYDPHNIKGSPGADFLPLIAPLTTTSRVIDTSTLSIPVREFHTILKEIFGKDVLELSHEERERVTFIITGVYSEVRILATAFKLRNDYLFPNVLVCPHLIGSKDADGHNFAIKAGFPDALVWVEPDLTKIARKTGIDIPPHILQEFHPCEIGPEEVTGRFPEEWQQIVTQCYCFFQQVTLKRLTGGFSGCGLFLVQGRKGKARTEHSVLKIGPHREILKELQGYHQVKDLMGSYIPRLETPVSAGTATAVRMELASKSGTPQTLQGFFESVDSPAALRKFLRVQKRLLTALSEKLYQNTLSEKPVYPYREHGLAQARQYRFLDENITGILGTHFPPGSALPLHPGLAIPDFREDFRRLVTFVDRLPCRVAQCHGDLNFANQLIDQRDNAWIIDWAYAGVKPLETDFAKMENDLVFVLSKHFTDTDLPRLARLEQFLLDHPVLPPVNHLPGELAFVPGEIRFQKLYEAVRQIRRAYQATAGRTGPLMYRIALLRYALHTLSFDSRRSRGECSPTQLKFALYGCAELIRLIAADECHHCGCIDRPENYPERFPVPPGSRSWHLAFPEYSPSYFVQADVLEQDCEITPGGWSEPENWQGIPNLAQRISGTGPIILSPDGRPLNPHGRTGIAGRGFFGRWGPNPAVDPIVIRLGPASGLPEFLLIKRPDSRQWGLPGVLVREGEKPADAAVRGLRQKCGIAVPGDRLVSFPQMFVEDYRNTDHAWMETLPCLYFFGSDLPPALNPPEHDQVLDVAWRDLSPELAGSLFASHFQVITAVLRQQLRQDQPLLPKSLIKDLLDLASESL
jgi:ADP-ribose pyrophosphatase